MGKYLASKNENNKFIVILFLFSLAIALVPIISLLKDVIDNGFYVGDRRGIRVIGFSGEDLRSSTGLASQLIPLCLFYVFIFLPYKKMQRQ